MAGSVNKVILVGNLGRDPEVRSTQDGTQGGQFVAGDLGKLERQEQRRAARTHRMAPGGDLQRAPGRRCREISEKGQQGLYRGPAADPQMDRSIGRRESTRPKSSSSASAANSPCLMAAVARRPMPAMAAACLSRPWAAVAVAVQAVAAVPAAAGIWTTISRSEQAGQRCPRTPSPQPSPASGRGSVRCPSSSPPRLWGERIEVRRAIALGAVRISPISL